MAPLNPSTDKSEVSLFTRELVERYLKVLALANRGSGGEKTTAEKIVQQMEAKYPGIKSVAELLGMPPSSSSSPHEATGPSDFQAWFQEAARFAKDAFGAALNATAGADLARTCDADWFMNEGKRRTKATVTITVPLRVLQRIDDLNEAQIHTFRTELSEMLFEQIDEIVESLE